MASYHAPYTGAALYTLGSKTLSGCGSKLSLTSPGAFNFSSGTAKATDEARVVACGNASGLADFSHAIGLKGLGFSPTTSASYYLGCNWSLTLKLSVYAKPLPSNASIGVGAALELHCWLIDLTTGAGTGYDDPILALSVNHGTQTVNWSNMAVSVNRTVSLTGGDRYEFLSYMSYQVEAISYSWTHAGAIGSASIGMSPPARGATMVSLVVAD